MTAKRKQPEDVVQTTLRLAVLGGLIWMGVIVYQVKKEGTV